MFHRFNSHNVGFKLFRNDFNFLLGVYFDCIILRVYAVDNSLIVTCFYFYPVVLEL